ncbi:MAG TPA: PD-(D/E)XK motif protein, partial [Polyangiaceae bacterium]
MSASEALWLELEAEAAQAPPGYVTCRVLPQSPLDLRLAVLKPSGERVVLLGGPRPDLDRVGGLPTTGAMALELIAAAADSPPRPVLRLMLTNRAYGDLFSLLADDLLRSMVSAADPAEGVRLFVQRVRRWHEFMRLVNPDGLSPEEQRGLFGELLVLADMLLPVAGAGVAVEGWTGPLRTPHDFQLPACAIEVKSTAATQPDSVSITNVRQLESPPDSTLVLAVVVLEETRVAGMTLPDMVERLRLLCTDARVVPRLDERLLASGYLDAHATRYASTRFNLRYTRLFD